MKEFIIAFMVFIILIMGAALYKKPKVVEKIVVKEVVDKKRTNKLLGELERSGYKMNCHKEGVWKY